MRALFFAFAALAIGTPAMAQEPDPKAEPEPAPIEVMILGTYHFANPGQDMVNMEVDDVLSGARQREIALLADSLASWQPTRVAVEAQAEAPDFKLANYADVDDLLATRRNESIQIGYRIAHMLGHEAVYGFDEQPTGDEPDYFPMGPVQEFAQRNGQDAINAGLFAKVQARVAGYEVVDATPYLEEAVAAS